MKKIITFTALILLVFPIEEASAHRPEWGAQYGPTKIPDLTTSLAFYRDLKAGQIDVYTFRAAEGEDFHAGLQIPAIPSLKSYGVSMALFGDGFDMANPAYLPSDYPEDLSALVLPSFVTGDYFEPFTQTNYWGRQQLDLAIPEDGDYFLLIWHPEGLPGKYVLDTGFEEVFSFSDLLRFPGWWLGVHIFFEHTPYLLTAATALVGIVGILIYRRVISRARPG